MIYKDVTTEEDKHNKLYKIRVIPETSKESEQLLKSLGVEYPIEPKWVVLNLDIYK